MLVRPFQIDEGFTGRPGEIPRDAFCSIESFMAATCLEPGTLVAVSGDGLSVSTPGVFGAVPVRARDDRSWRPGDYLPVVRSGKIWVKWSGADQAAATLYIAADGSLTDQPTPLPAPAGLAIVKPRRASVALVDVNLGA
jgi:hypothetical protein